MRRREIIKCAREHNSDLSDRKLGQVHDTLFEGGRMSNRCIHLFGDATIERDRGDLIDAGLWPVFKYTDSRSSQVRFFNKNLAELGLNDEGNYVIIGVSTDVAGAHVLNDSDFFTEHQLDVLRRANISNEVTGYHSGTRYYTFFKRNLGNDGVFRVDENDDSYSMGFELETDLDSLEQITPEIRNTLNTHLGHFERDGSISGPEFDSHPFSYNMLLKIKPLFKKMFEDMSQAGLTFTPQTGLHIHIGRSAFIDESALMKFYYALNNSQLEDFWKEVSRRDIVGRDGTNNYGYCQFSRLNAARTHIEHSMNAHQHDHARAVNFEHESTIEVRIFRSTLNTDMVYDYLTLIKQLVDACNTSAKKIKMLNAVEGTRFKGLSTLNYWITQELDVSFIAKMTREQYTAAIQAALTANNMNEVVRLGQEFQDAYGSQGIGRARQGGNA